MNSEIIISNGKLTDVDIIVLYFILFLDLLFLILFNMVAINIHRSLKIYLHNDKFMYLADEICHKLVMSLRIV